MEVCARGTPGRSDIADDIAAVYGLTTLDVESAEVTVARRDPEVVAKDNQVTVFTFVRRGLHFAVGRGVDRLSLRRGDVETAEQVAPGPSPG